MNDHTAQSMESRVVSIHRARDGKQYIGVEFISPETNFWHMQFPIPGARPLRRIVPNKVSRRTESGAFAASPFQTSL